MPAQPPKITCLFYSDITVATFLNTAAGRTLAGDLLVECGARPAFGYLLNLDTPVNYPGVAGLLGGIDIGTLSHPTERLPAPILLAPGAPASAVALRAGLRQLTRPDERLTAVTLLVALADARAMGSSLAVADTFAIAWDTTALPHDELVDFSRWLASEKLLTTENFAGLFSYGAPPLDSGHVQRVSGLLASRSPQLRDEIIATS